MALFQCGSFGKWSRLAELWKESKFGVICCVSEICANLSVKLKTMKRFGELWAGNAFQVKTTTLIQARVIEWRLTTCWKCITDDFFHPGFTLRGEAVAFGHFVVQKALFQDGDHMKEHFHA